MKDIKQNKTPSAKYYDLLSEHYDQVTSKPGVWTPPSVVVDHIQSILK